MPIIIKNKVVYGDNIEAITMHDSSSASHDDIRELIDDIEARLSALENIDIAEGGAY